MAIEAHFAGWRTAARALLQDGVSPHQVTWHESSGVQASLLPNDVARVAGDRGLGGHLPKPVPAAFLKLAESVACHVELARWDALYRVVYRLTHGEPSLLEVMTDPDVYRVMAMDKAVRRAVHKMHAFVRFRIVESEKPARRDVPDTEGTTYVAWFEPVHNVVERAAPLFVRRFASMRWSILTPRACAHWDGATVQFTPGVSRNLAPSEDKLEELWRSYYAHIFNPARLSIGAMRAEMPKQYWANLPEARLIPSLVREAPLRVARMLAQLDQPAADLPEDMRSRVGDVDMPLRPIAALSRDVPSSLDIPGAWDTTHDPGMSVARQRAANARAVLSAGIATSRGDDQVPAPFVMNDVPVRVGTASWTDPTLLQRGVFYPDGLTTPEGRLRYYASRFGMVEVDATFYVPPTRAMAATWAARTPPGFVFDIKAFALMTGHGAETKRLPDWLRRLLPRSLVGAARVYAKDLSVAVIDQLWARFMEALSPLRDADKLGPVLLQYPSWFVPSRESADALRAARERLGGARAAVEFRNPAWVTGRVAARTFTLLEELQLTYVIVDAPPGTASSMPPVAPVTTPDLAVVRLHGRRSATWELKHRIVSERYRYLYDAEELRGWTTRLGDLTSRMSRTIADFPDMAKAKQGVHVVYNNCHANYGTTNADEITALLIEFDEIRKESGAANVRAGS